MFSLSSQPFPSALLVFLVPFMGAGVSTLQAQLAGTSGALLSTPPALFSGIAPAPGAVSNSELSYSSSTSLDATLAERENLKSGVLSTAPNASPQPQPARYGGIHEFTVDSGISRMSGHWLGYRRDVDVEMVHLGYSRVMKNGRHVTVSYATEVTPFIDIDEPILNDNDNGTVELYRKQTSGGGVTPIGFRFDFLPHHRIQPFWRCNYGVLYFRDRVLSPEGSQFMHTVDFGAGFHIFETRDFATTVGFRYIHMSNANISEHNPGTDAETFSIGFSRFRSPRSREVQ